MEFKKEWQPYEYQKAILALWVYLKDKEVLDGSGNKIELYSKEGMIQRFGILYENAQDFAFAGLTNNDTFFVDGWQLSHLSIHKGGIVLFTTSHGRTVPNVISKYSGLATTQEFKKLLSKSIAQCNKIHALAEYLHLNTEEALEISITEEGMQMVYAGLKYFVVTEAGAFDLLEEYYQEVAEQEGTELDRLVRHVDWESFAQGQEKTLDQLLENRFGGLNDHGHVKKSTYEYYIVRVA